MDLAAGRILVAGATGGIGSAVARALAARGSRLVLGGRDPRRLEEIGRELGAPIVAGDLRDLATAPRLVAEGVRELGGLEAVVCAVGVVAFGPVESLSDVVLEELFAVNVLGPVRLARAALPALSPGGSIVNLSGVVATSPMAGLAAYSASKAALSAFDTALRREARHHRVQVLDVRPPHTETGLASRAIAGVPPTLPEGLRPDDVAVAIVQAMATDAREVLFG